LLDRAWRRASRPSAANHSTELLTNTQTTPVWAALGRANLREPTHGKAQLYFLLHLGERIMPATKVKPTNRLNGSPVQESLYSLDKIRIKAVGITPLLCSNPSSMQPDLESGKPTRGGAKAKDDSVEAICRRAAYFDDDGNCAFPNAAIVSAIKDAAALLKLRVGTGKYAPSALTILEGGIWFDDKVIMSTLVHPKTGKPLTEKDYKVDMRRAVNQKTGGAIVAIRPRFEEWSTTFHLLVDTGNANLMAMIDQYGPTILGYAGISVGFGAFRAYIRPKKKTDRAGGQGPFGKCTLTII
jgi:hypothetical protein